MAPIYHFAIARSAATSIRTLRRDLTLCPRHSSRPPGHEASFYAVRRCFISYSATVCQSPSRGRPSVVSLSGRGRPPVEWPPLGGPGCGPASPAPGPGCDRAASGLHRTRQRCSGRVCHRPSASRPVSSSQNHLQARQVPPGAPGGGFDGTERAGTRSDGHKQGRNSADGCGEDRAGSGPAASRGSRPAPHRRAVRVASPPGQPPDGPGRPVTHRACCTPRPPHGGTGSSKDGQNGGWSSWREDGDAGQNHW